MSYRDMDDEFKTIYWITAIDEIKLGHGYVKQEPDNYNSEFIFFNMENGEVYDVQFFVTERERACNELEQAAVK